MKKIIIIKIITFTFAILLLNIKNSYAALEIKDTTTATLTNKTISEFYDMAEEMKNPGQGLEGSNVDVKMANNYDWAVVSYFSNSSYGTGGAGGNEGSDFETSVKTHKSTNGNITGVMDWGKNYTHTAGIIPNWKKADGTINIVGSYATYGASIIADADTNRIDKFNANLSEAIAKTGWYSPKINRIGEEIDEPYSVRLGLFGIQAGTYGSGTTFGNGYRCTGAAKSDYTFRPVFYAQ